MLPVSRHIGVKAIDIDKRKEKDDSFIEKTAQRLFKIIFDGHLKQFMN